MAGQRRTPEVLDPMKAGYPMKGTGTRAAHPMSRTSCLWGA
jgi:hypothetical protein